MRLIDADAFEKVIRNKLPLGLFMKRTIPSAMKTIGELVEELEKAPTVVDQWYYPSKGEYPPNMQRVLLCLHTGYGQDFVVGYLNTDSEQYKSGHAWGWYDFGNRVFQDFADEIEVIAWQYLIPQKEEA